jgi:integrase/recombinase XerD
VTAIKKVTESLTMKEMFERFIWFKQSEGLAPRTMEEYHIHFQWLLNYLDKDLSREEITPEVFLERID